ncbi:MAG: sensor histidine kinase, partial [Rudaea sp.]
AIVIADRAVDDGAPHRRTYVLAVLLGCAAAVVVSELFGEPWRVALLGENENRPADISWIRYHSFHPISNFAILLMTGAPAVFFYADRRAAMKTAAILHAAELDRVRRSRIALESRLQAMQARVEPQFLFNTLDQVEHLYAQDPALGGRMLDDLIAYLRAAMPLMRDTSSTVAQELELARSHLGIAKIRLGDRLAFDIDVPAGLGSARMPPMMLLPLLDHALGRGLARSGSGGTIRIGVGVEASRLSLRIADSGAGFVPEAGGDGIASIRERLHALYGSAARLGLRMREGGGSEAVIDVPYEIGAAAAA